MMRDFLAGDAKIIQSRHMFWREANNHGGESLQQACMHATALSLERERGMLLIFASLDFLDQFLQAVPS